MMRAPLRRVILARRQHLTAAWKVAPRQDEVIHTGEVLVEVRASELWVW